jgi:hypothetical protein
MSKIKLYYFWNKNQEELLTKYFLPTFLKYNKENFELVGEEFSNENNVSHFGSIAFKKLIIQKVKAIINILDNSLENEFFVVSDIDIQFFDSIYDTIIEYMNKNNDIIFQKENSGGDTVNTGFMLIKNTKQTKEFWINILDDLKSSDENFFINEQALANLKLDQISSDTFNGTIWNWSQGLLNSKIILHHANCVATTQDKILQLEHVKNFINV